jgi:hypothetical protein
MEACEPAAVTAPAAAAASAAASAYAPSAAYAAAKVSGGIEKWFSPLNYSIEVGAAAAVEVEGRECGIIRWIRAGKREKER